MSEPIDWQDAPSTATPITAANLKAHDAWMVAQVEAAQSSANAAAASAAEAAAPADDTIAALVANAATATRAQLDARYATGDDLAALQAQSASVEDLFVAVTIQTHGSAWSNTTDLSAPLLHAPFPLAVTSVALTSWTGAVVNLSDTSYWRAVVRKANVNNTLTTDIAYKSTRVTAAAPYPAGQVWTPRTAWTFNSAAFANATLAAGEVLYLATLPIGTPTALGVPFLATVGYRPL